MTGPSPRLESWPSLADKAVLAGGSDLYVYGDRAMIQPEPADTFDRDSTDVWLDADQLRAWAADLLWAADRLDAR